jgi:transcriptional regulator of aromatic amino acid metabolism
LKENVTTLQEKNSQLEDYIKKKESESLAKNTVVKDDMQYLLELLQYNISLLRQKDEDLQTLIRYDLSNLKSNLSVLQQNLERESKL